MSNFIQVTADTLQQTQNVIVSNNHNIQSILSALQQQVASLENTFKGAAATKYQEYYKQWHVSAQNLNEALNGIATLTGTVLQQFQDRDSEIASQIQL